jgi:hypothetical protein
MRLASSGVEHRHRRFVSVQDRLLRQFGPQCIHQRLQLHAAGSDPLRQRGARDRQAGPPKDGFLPVQRQVVGELANQHLRQQTAGGDALVDHVRRHRRLHQLLAPRAGPLAAHVALHRKDARLVIELLGSLLANSLHLAAAGADGTLRLVEDLAPGQFSRQRLALRLVSCAGCLALRIEALDFLGDCLQAYT